VGSAIRRESVQIVLAFLAGVLLSLGLLGGREVAGLWRPAVLPVALLLVVRALVGMARLGRAEWRRDRTGARPYLAVVLRSVIAYLLVVIALAP
jgi:hypothetical protein